MQSVTALCARHCRTAAESEPGKKGCRRILMMAFDLEPPAWTQEESGLVQLCLSCKRDVRQ